jgi:hypothetical protein
MVEAEVIHLKRMGLRFETIAEHIARVGRGQAQATMTIPRGVIFPPDFTITRQGCHKAFIKAVGREPALKVAEMRKLDTARCEDYIINLQPAILKGDARAVAVAVKVLAHKARINGYAQSNPEPVERNDEIKSQAELDAENARNARLFDTFYEAVQILVDLGVPLPPPRERQLIDTVAAETIPDGTDDAV